MSLSRSNEATAALRALLWLCLLALAASASRAELLPVKTYTIADGLASDGVASIVQDSRGYLWFCTREGVSRFDGYGFATYGLGRDASTSAVSGMLETRDGAYWLATSGSGVWRFDPTVSDAEDAGRAPSAHPKFTRIPVEGNDRARFVNVLVEGSGGAIWCGTAGGLYRLDRDGSGAMREVEIALPGDAADTFVVFAIAAEPSGAIWVGTSNGLYRLFEDGRTERYSTADGLPSTSIRSALVDRDGRIWVGTSEGLCELVADPRPNGAAVARVLTQHDGLAGAAVSALFQASDGRIWAGTTGGLGVLARDGSGLRSYTAENGLSDASIQAIAEDRDGNIWAGSESGGAMKVARSGFTTFTSRDGLGGDRVLSIFADRDGAVCVAGAGLAVSRFDGERFKAVTPNVAEDAARGVLGAHQAAFQDREGDWWVPTFAGLYRFSGLRGAEQLARAKPAAVYTTRDGLAGDRITRLFEDSRGNLWIGSAPLGHEGLTLWDRATGAFRKFTSADGIPAEGAHAGPLAICEDRFGSVWVSFYRGGLGRYSGGTFGLFTSAAGLPDGRYYDIFVDSAGRLWVASSPGGLIRADDPGSEAPHFVVYTTENGLSSDDVTSVVEDAWGRIFAGTGRGVDELDPATGHIKHYTKADGLASNAVDEAFRDSAGALWFGTKRGLSRFVPEPSRPVPPPSVLIGGIRIAGVPRAVSGLGEADVAGIELVAGQNQIQIDYYGLGFRTGDVLRYEYELEGTDGGWSPPTEQRSINYAELPPGAYRFLVRAVNSDGAASPTPASVAFRILPPIWRRWWFLTLAAIAVALTIYVADRYRIARLIELERVRTRIATDLHDDIGSSLSQISVLTEVVHRTLDQDARVSEPLGTIAGLSRDLIDSMSDIVWAINPQRDHLRDLTQRMRRFASDAFTSRGIELDFRAPAVEQDMRLGADIRREVFLVFKESVNNAVRHSGCARAEVEFRVEAGLLEMRVCDDGRGFDAARDGDGNGLESMRRRAEKLGGTIEIDSAPDRGTSVRLRAPAGRRGLRGRWRSTSRGR